MALEIIREENRKRSSALPRISEENRRKAVDPKIDAVVCLFKSCDRLVMPGVHTSKEILEVMKEESVSGGRLFPSPLHLGTLIGVYKEEIGARLGCVITYKAHRWVFDRPYRPETEW